jgi:hypothetical protein
MFSSLVLNDACKLDKFFGSVAQETKDLQTTRCEDECQNVTNRLRWTHPDGIRRSFSTSPGFVVTSSVAIGRLDCTLTTIRAGFRKPALTSSDIASASVIVALNKPVLLCLGSRDRILVRLCWKPRSSNLRSDVIKWVIYRVPLTFTDLLRQEQAPLAPLCSQKPYFCRVKTLPRDQEYQLRCPTPAYGSVPHPEREKIAMTIRGEGQEEGCGSTVCGKDQHLCQGAYPEVERIGRR